MRALVQTDVSPSPIVLSARPASTTLSPFSSTCLRMISRTSLYAAITGYTPVLQPGSIISLSWPDSAVMTSLSASSTSCGQSASKPSSIISTTLTGVATSALFSLAIVCTRSKKPSSLPTGANALSPSFSLMTSRSISLSLALMTVSTLAKLPLCSYAENRPLLYTRRSQCGSSPSLRWSITA